MASRGTRTLRSIMTAATAFAWLALLAGSGGCEVAIGDTVPAFACNGPVDTCPQNQVCNPETHVCVASCPGTPCKDGTFCDPLGLCEPYQPDAGMLADVVVVNDTGIAPPDTSSPVDSSAPDTSVPPPDTGTVETSGPCRSVGCPCSGPAGCDSNVCGDKQSVTASLYTAAGNQNFCTKPCCTSSDCDPGSVCFATAAGGNYCVLPTWIGRTTSEGMGGGGATCSTGRDCRSGVCGPAGACADTCCSDQAGGQCTAPSQCTFAAFPGTGIDTHYSANCQPSPGNRNNGSSCNSNSSCVSQLCASDNGTFNDCHGACRNSADCGSSYACSYVLPDMNGDLVAACTAQNGTTPLGQSCSTTNDTCGQGFCDPGSLKCTSICFTDADCKAAGGHCRPEQVTVFVNGQPGGSYSVLACGS